MNYAERTTEPTPNDQRRTKDAEPRTPNERHRTKEPAANGKMSTSYVEAEKLEPTAFEGQYFDQYDYYNLTDRYSLPGGASRKGRTKKEASDNTNRFNPGGHERKITEKLQNSEEKKKGAKA